MYKSLALLILVVLGATYASHPYSTNSKQFQHLSSSFERKTVGLDLCPSCINEVVELINILLNEILDRGILVTCGDLCEAVGNKTGSKVLQDLCDVACDGLGVDEFVKLIIKEDLDPIYYCELVDMCPINDQGDAKFTNFGVSPKTGPQGTTFVIDLSYKTVNGTGTGSFTFNIVDPKNETSGDLYWFEAKKPGQYTEKIGFRTFTLSTCDPSSGRICDDFPVGTYNVTAQICNGECGATHPHTAVYDAGFASFVVTKKQ